MNEELTSTHYSRDSSGRRARHALALAALLWLAAAGHAWAQTTPPATTPAAPAAPATEPKPAEEAKGPNTGRLSVNAGGIDRADPAGRRHGLSGEAASIRGARAPAVELAIARFAELERAGREAAALRRALEDRKTIERAKGLLMDRLGLPEAAAFRLLHKSAMDRHTPIVALAERLLAGEGPTAMLERR